MSLSAGSSHDGRRRPPGARRAGKGGRKPRETARVFALHEDPTTLMMLKRDLEGSGAFEVSGARSPRSAIERLRASEVHIVAVLLNWGLPIRDHFAVISSTYTA